MHTLRSQNSSNQLQNEHKVFLGVPEFFLGFQSPSFVEVYKVNFCKLVWGNGGMAPRKPPQYAPVHNTFY